MRSKPFDRSKNEWQTLGVIVRGSPKDLEKIRKFLYSQSEIYVVKVIEKRGKIYLQG